MVKKTKNSENIEKILDLGTSVLDQSKSLNLDDKEPNLHEKGPFCAFYEKKVQACAFL
jgi:hypothetical protein